MKTKILNFMRNRYGSDELNICLIVLSVLFTFLAPFWRVFSHLSLVCIVFAFYRMFSKNIYKRRAENARIVPYFNFIKAKIKNRGQAKLFMCPKCKTTLRVPKGKGNITLTCLCGEKLKRKS